MYASLKRLLIAASVLGFGLMAAAPALADANSFAWTDISAQLSTTTNRPVWAMAYANGNWFYSDGQDLWNGGQSYRYDGATQVNITTDVRTAGISRVDDIVSDGQSILYLQNMTPRNNSFLAVEYTNGSYVNVGYALRNALNTDEGIANISGRNGDWYITTSKGRVLHWFGNTSTPTQVTLPSNLQVNVNNAYLDLLADGMSGGYGYKNNQFRVVPISGNQWLFVYDSAFYQMSTTYPVTAQMFRYDGSSFTDISSNLQAGTDVIIASNGSSAIVVENCPSCSNIYNQPTTRLYLIVDSSGVHSYNTSVNMTGTPTWTGSSWMIFGGSNKRVIHIVDGFSEDLGEARDYFVTGAANNSGTVLLGGAVSVLGNGQPTSPLTAKLVKVIDNGTTNGSTNIGSTSFGGGRTTTSSNGPTITTSGNPSNFVVGNGGTFDYLATASDPNGVNRIDLYVNGGLIKTCYATTCEYDQQYLTNGLSSRTIPFYAVATDNSGYSTNGSSNQDTLTVTQGSTASANSNTTNSANTQTQNGISFWSWFEPTQSTIRRDQFVTFNVGAWSTKGINNIQILVNGTARQTCNLSNATGNQSCSVSIYGGDYALNTNVSVNAKVTDGSGQVAWTTLQNLTVVDVNGSTNNNTNNSDISAWTTVDPTGSTLNRSSSAILHVQSSATQGLSRIDVYANNAVIRTCNFSSAYGTQSCDVTVYGSNYSAGTQLSLNALATASNGQTAWSDTRVLTVQDNGSTNTNSNGNSWISSSPDVSTLSAGSSVTFTVDAIVPQGLQRIDIYVNGSVANTCTPGSAYAVANANGDNSCFTIVNANSYAAGSSVYVNAKITDSNGNVMWSTARTYTISSTTNTTQNGTGSTTQASSWVWSNPEESSLATNSNVTFNVGAYAVNGIQKIEILVNGTIWNTCNLGNAYGNQSCSAVIAGSTYQPGSSVFVNARITDSSGNITWSPSRSYTITGTTTSTQTNTGNTTQTWIWNHPDQTTLTMNTAVDFNVGAWDADGLRRIEIWVNGQVKQTCDYATTAFGNQQCAFQVAANNYAAGSDIFVNADVTDALGNVIWSQSQTYHIQTSNQTTGTSPSVLNNQSGSIQVTNDHTNGFGANDTVTFTANAQDLDGVNHIDILVNAELVKTCTGVAACSYTGGPYPTRTSVSYGAKVVDNKGFAIWTGYQTINKK